MTDFALDALEAWKPHENTRACWNPLATTLKVSGSWTFNPAGVQNYADRSAGVRATADTLSLSYYDPIRSMLRQESFDEQLIRRSLETWSGSGGYVPALLATWKSLWEAAHSSQPPLAITPINVSRLAELRRYGRGAGQIRISL